MPRVLEAIGHEWLIAIAAIATAFFTFTLWWSTHKLWKATWNTALAQERDTRILQRAYIAVEPRGIHLLSDGNRVLGHVGIKNAGNLPARNVSWRIRMKVNKDGGLNDFPLEEEEEGRIVIAPSSIARQGSQDSIALSEIVACGGGGSHYLYVWGIVRYDNGFKRRCFTKFCHRYNCRSQPIGPIPESGARYHTHGNDAD
jgi:hypothetical protein